MDIDSVDFESMEKALQIMDQSLVNAYSALLSIKEKLDESGDY